jgi:hypothetical protein
MYNKRKNKYDNPTNVKTKYNDFRLFVDWLKSDFRGIGFPANVGGLIQRYKIHEDNLLYVHPTNEAPRQLEPNVSNDVYKYAFAKRKTLFAWAKEHGILVEDSRAHQAQVKAREDIDKTQPTLFDEEQK